MAFLAKLNLTADTTREARVGASDTARQSERERTLELLHCHWSFPARASGSGE